jgi:hypothetical protein
MGDGLINLIPDQLAKQGSRPMPPIWHVDLAGSFTSLADKKAGITHGSVDEVFQNATAIARSNTMLSSRLQMMADSGVINLEPILPRR